MRVGVSVLWMIFLSYSDALDFLQLGMTLPGVLSQLLFYSSFLATYSMKKLFRYSSRSFFFLLLVVWSISILFNFYSFFFASSQNCCFIFNCEVFSEAREGALLSSLRTALLSRPSVRGRQNFSRREVKSSMEASLSKQKNSSFLICLQAKEYLVSAVLRRLKALKKQMCEVELSSAKSKWSFRQLFRQFSSLICSPISSSFRLNTFYRYSLFSCSFRFINCYSSLNSWQISCSWISQACSMRVLLPLQMVRFLSMSSMRRLASPLKSWLRRVMVGRASLMEQTLWFFCSFMCRYMHCMHITAASCSQQNIRDSLWTLHLTSAGFSPCRLRLLLRVES